MTINYKLVSAERKPLVAAISEILEVKAEYLGKKGNYGYQIGEYQIDRNGVLTGPDNRELIEALRNIDINPETTNYDATEEAAELDETAPQQAETETVDEQPTTEAETQAEAPKRQGILDIIVEELNANAEDGTSWERLHTTPQMECGDGRWRNLDGTFAKTTESEAVEEIPVNSLAIEIPISGFDPAKIENLRRMVEAKANLLKTAFGMEELPIQVQGDRICFPWYQGEELPTSEKVEAYSTFISQLCKTAIAKTRVTATARIIEGSEKYAMRCFMLSLGMIGPEFQNSRRTLLAKFEGDSSWKNGKPEKIAAADESGGGVALAYLAIEDENGKVVTQYTMGFNAEKSEHDMIMEQLPEGTQIIKFYNAFENGERRMITNENGEKRYVITQDDDGYPRITHKP